MFKIEQLVPIDAHWAVRESFAEAAYDVLTSISVEVARDLTSAARQQDEETDPTPYQLFGNVAVHGLTGPMTKKQTSMSYFFGGTSTVMLARAIREASKDPAVKAQLIVIDSPGGQAQGTSDLADAIAGVNAKTPVYAFVDGLAASAAYWACSACVKSYASRMSEVGCIGTYAVVRDSSQAFASQGVKVFVIRDGEYKGMGAPGTELTAEHQAELKREVAALNAHFVGDVAKNRKFTDEQAKSLADGRIHVGQEAVALGLIDGICSLEECLQTISSDLVTRQPAAGGGKSKQEKSMTEEKKQSILERLSALFRDDADTPPVSAKLSESDQALIDKAKATLATTSKTLAASLVETSCGSLDAATKEAVLPLAVAAVQADNGEIGAACKAFTALAAASKSPIDMKTPMIVKVVEQSTDAKAKLEADSKKVLAGAVGAINNAGGN